MSKIIDDDYFISTLVFFGSWIVRLFLFDNIIMIMRISYTEHEVLSVKQYFESTFDINLEQLCESVEGER